MEIKKKIKCFFWIVCHSNIKKNPYKFGNFQKNNNFLKNFLNLMANSCNHFKALLKKNWVLFKRSPCGSCCEIVTPIVFALFLIAVRSLVSKESMPETSYIEKATVFTKNPIIDPSLLQVYQTANLTVKELLLARIYNSSHIKYLLELYLLKKYSFQFRNCNKQPKGGQIALSPQNELTEKIKERFQRIF